MFTHFTSGHNICGVLVPEWFFIIVLQLLPTHSTHFATFEFQKRELGLKTRFISLLG